MFFYQSQIVTPNRRLSRHITAAATGADLRGLAPAHREPGPICNTIELSTDTTRRDASRGENIDSLVDPSRGPACRHARGPRATCDLPISPPSTRTDLLHLVRLLVASCLYSLRCSR